MRVCLVSREYPTDDHGGGIGTYTEKTARALAVLGHEVEVITEAVAEASVTVEDGVIVHRLPATRARHLRTLARARAVARRLRNLDHEPDIVQACEFGAEAVWYCLSRRRRAKLVTRLATPSFVVRELNEHGARRGRGSALLDLLERLQTSRSDAVTSISESITEIVSTRWHIPRPRITQLKTGVDFAVRYSSTSTELPPELAGTRYILFFGRLEERKGVHILAQALPELLDRHADVHAVFVGTPLPYQGRPMDEFVRSCNAAHANRLHFLPRQTQPVLHALIAKAAIVTLPSLWEGLGNVALEAIDMGKAVVATSGSGFHEVIEDGRAGVLVPPGDVTALRAALGRLLDDPMLLRSLEEAARERAAQFELMEVCRQLAGFYRALLSDKAPADFEARHGQRGDRYTPRAPSIG